MDGVSRLGISAPPEREGIGNGTGELRSMAIRTTPSARTTNLALVTVFGAVGAATLGLSGSSQLLALFIVAVLLGIVVYRALAGR